MDHDIGIAYSQFIPIFMVDVDTDEVKDLCLFDSCRASGIEEPVIIGWCWNYAIVLCILLIVESE